jgi:peptidoglycan/LPS O-acetylase OafA/YrhL
MRRIGLMSFSLYLWQQAFTAADGPFFGFLPLLPAIAFLSWALIEQPMIRLGRRFAQDRNALSQNPSLSLQTPPPPAR